MPTRGLDTSERSVRVADVTDRRRSWRKGNANIKTHPGANLPGAGVVR